MKSDALRVSTLALVLIVSGPAAAQEITGTPGSPSATTTIDGRQIPPPPGQFGGVINLDAPNSKSYWQPQAVPPQERPQYPPDPHR